MIHAGPIGIYRTNWRYLLIRKRGRIGFIYPWGGGSSKQIAYGLDIDEEKNKGFMTRSLLTVLPYIPRVYRQLMIHPTNKPSLRVAEKCKFVYFRTRESGILCYRHPTFINPCKYGEKE